MIQPEHKLKHLVIIYENTGGGHLNAANIIKNMLSGPKVRVSLVSVSELMRDEDNNIFVRGWNYLVKRSWLRTADLIMNFILRIFLLPVFYSIYPRSVFSELDKLKPDIVISTSDGNRLFGAYCKQEQVPFFIFVTEATIFLDILSPHARYLVCFKEVADIINSFQMTSYFTTDMTPAASLFKCFTDILNQWVRYSIGYPITPYFKRYTPSIKLKNNLPTTVIGPIRDEHYYQPKDPIQIKQDYHIPEDGYCILVSSGSLGGVTVHRIVHAFMNNPGITKTLNLILICGADEHLHHEMCNTISPIDNIRLIPVREQPNLADLYQIADCSIGRGTAGILIDSLVSKTPLIVLKKVTSNDLGTLDIIRQHQIGEIAKNYQHIPLLLEKILDDQPLYIQAMHLLLDKSQSSDYQAIKIRLHQLIFNEDQLQNRQNVA